MTVMDYSSISLSMNTDGLGHKITKITVLRCEMSGCVWSTWGWKGEKSKIME